MPAATEDGTRAGATSGVGGLAVDDERALVAQAKQGSTAAVEELVQRYERRIFRLAQNITSNYEDAEEVTQNVFFNAFRNLSVFRGDSRFYTWLVRITINEALMKVRGRRFVHVSIDEVNEQDGERPLQLQDWGPNPEQSYSQEELRKILEAGISKLAPAYRIVFQLRDVEGFSIEETAHALGISVAAVKARLFRARLQLRDRLDIYFRPPKKLGSHLRNSGEHLVPGAAITGGVCCPTTATTSSTRLR
jgi:RNA polymerase sigma-70 factor, ECF subfamily